jgi:hypothetical protein
MSECIVEGCDGTVVGHGRCISCAGLDRFAVAAVPSEWGEVLDS